MRPRFVPMPLSYVTARAGQPMFVNRRVSALTFDLLGWPGLAAALEAACLIGECRRVAGGVFMDWSAPVGLGDESRN